ncbi:MAG: type I-F CRISPR-associated helicase Cas3f [Fluviicoccus sp.]|uniref:type I-F CRISPR-associated helicase Cas3f n=1 Tax=Fluviicoccus sp. TaxID=2003552 RepID=UPI00271F5FDF|nr:type I-F CRISPR-associated helicase Cas3f [Fluviicoccus sp.]MDO8330881.1 type I-F CRISPR-associated helicase Cas3f [Fluviicoccus sp.]
MNILLVSQCSKRALTETRRILDQFAERRGERTWQTPITQQGVDTLRKLLKKTARKNTAVACHWIRGLDHSELMWIVGDASQFNEQGAVPTNTTTRDVLRAQDENDWHTAEDIKLLARMAALWHDFGKANKAFQDKLKKATAIADAYRHEWVSLRLFEAFVLSFGDKVGDAAWLQGLASLGAGKADLRWLDAVAKDGESKPGERPPQNPFRQLPPLAQAVGWLIVTHHRLPVNDQTKPTTLLLNRLPGEISSAWCGSRPDEKSAKDCWKVEAKNLPFASEAWRQKAAHCAAAMHARKSLLTGSWLHNPYALHLARLTLMLADHHYSSLPVNPKWGDKTFPAYANTDKEGKLKQPLDNHLLGVDDHARRISGVLPRLDTNLPRLCRHKGFRRRSADARFRWQDKAFDVAESVQARSQDHGFFGINMASTGCGKTLANGRIMYALADPQRGARFSIALGLRTLTLQTGQAYRDLLEIGDDDLAVLVGGAAVRELFERQQNASDSAAGLTPQMRGSESAEALIPDNSYVSYESSLPEGGLSDWLKQNPAANKLLCAPILTCTIDHLIPATESTRGGHQIAPMLRLMTSDLVLDEPDDFDLSDLPALSRLVFWAGMLGSRVLLSSATLPPALVEGLFNAYKEGRRSYQQNRGIPGLALNICCAWFDEFSSQASDHMEAADFKQAHEGFVLKRLSKLKTADQRRIAQIHDLPPLGKSRQDISRQWAEHLLAPMQVLHQHNGMADPKTGKRVSFGLVRMANIDPLIDVAQALLAQGAPADTRIHLCVYHSRYPLLLRSNIEAMLDRVLKRQSPVAVLDHPAVREPLDQYPELNHLFVVLASPVAEVGRDHDYDWAIVEPSSMRSVIQLAGRIRRHRPEVYNVTNLYLLNTNIKSLEKGVGKATYCHPGFEHEGYLLGSHDLHHLLREEEWRCINAAPRIQERAELQPEDSLVDLEHVRLRALMLNDLRGKEAVIFPASAWWETPAHLSGWLQGNPRFRASQPERLYGLMPDEEAEQCGICRYEEKLNRWTPLGTSFLEAMEPVFGPGVGLWRQQGYLDALVALAAEKDMPLLRCAERFGVVSLAEGEETKGWKYHEGLGFRRRY